MVGRCAVYHEGPVARSRKTRLRPGGDAAIAHFLGGERDQRVMVQRGVAERAIKALEPKRTRRVKPANIASVTTSGRGSGCEDLRSSCRRCDS